MTSPLPFRSLAAGRLDRAVAAGPDRAALDQVADDDRDRRIAFMRDPLEPARDVERKRDMEDTPRSRPGAAAAAGRFAVRRSIVSSFCRFRASDPSLRGGVYHAVNAT